MKQPVPTRAPTERDRSTRGRAGAVPVAAKGRLVAPGRLVRLSIRCSQALDGLVAAAAALADASALRAALSAAAADAEAALLAGEPRAALGPIAGRIRRWRRLDALVRAWADDGGEIAVAAGRALPWVARLADGQVGPAEVGAATAAWRDLVRGLHQAGARLVSIAADHHDRAWRAALGPALDLDRAAADAAPAFERASARGAGRSFSPAGAAARAAAAAMLARADLDPALCAPHGAAASAASALRAAQSARVAAGWLVDAARAVDSGVVEPGAESPATLAARLGALLAEAGAAAREET